VTWDLLQKNSFAGPVNSGTQTVQFTTANVTSASLLVVTISTNNTTGLSCSDDKNGSYGSPAVSKSGSASQVAVFSFANSTGGVKPTVTVSGLGANASISISEWAGGAVSSVLDTTNNAAAASGAASASVAITPAGSGELYIGVLRLLTNATGLAENSSGAFTPVNLYSQTTPLNQLQDTLYFVNTGSTSQSAAWSWTSNQGYEAVVAAFLPAAAEGPEILAARVMIYQP
jgi:hypothetical protein